MVVEPGPARILPAEAAIEADPAMGIEDAVILVEETDWREKILGGATIRRHVRAKILSAPGRSLADVEIPASLREPRIDRWWARTILPDGRVLELGQDALERQTLAESRRYRVSTLKAALPGVEPGCVIDYGYEVRVDPPSFDRIVLLQQPWPVREIRFRWQPDNLLPSNFLLYKAAALDIEYRKDGKALLVIGRGLPPVPEEPYMPPLQERRASVTFYYLWNETKSPDQFWNRQAAEIARSTERFIRDRRATRETLERIGISPGADPADSLRRVYEWIGQHIELRRLRSAEQVETSAGRERPPRDLNRAVLESRQAVGWQLDQLFIGFARELGARAEMVMVMNRDFKYWWPSLMDVRQFDDAVVAVRLPGEERHFVDPGSGLPYGQVPWWYTGVPTAVFASDGYERVVIPLPEGRDNVTRSRGRLRFVEGNAAVEAVWSREFGPQAGLLERRSLRRRDPGRRRDRVYRLCGESNEVEVVSARTPGLGDADGGLSLECDCEILIEPIDAGVDRYHWPIDGVWNPALPELVPGERKSPVVLDYPRVDVTELEVRAPVGFEPGEPPARKEIVTPFGRYLLEFERIDGGFKVRRFASVVSAGVEPADYDALVDYVTEIKRADASSVEFRRTGS